MSKPRKPKVTESPPSAANLARQNIAKANKDANKKAQAAYRTETGKAVSYKHLTDDQITYALDMISNGAMMITVTEQLGVSDGALQSRAATNPDFAHRLNEARAAGAWAIASYGHLAVLGHEGYTSGSITRDKAIAESCWKWAKHLNQKVFGDKVQVDQRTISINIDRDEGEGW